MRLHTNNIVHMAGATGDKIEKIAQVIIQVQENKITVSRAKENEWFWQIL